MRVLPGVVAVAVTAVAVALAGCSQFDAALGQRQAVVAFKPGTPVPQRLALRSACAQVPDVKAPPVPSDLNPPCALQQLTFRIDHASNADVARLEKCLARFPSVVAVSLQKTTEMGG